MQVPVTAPGRCRAAGASVVRTILRRHHTIRMRTIVRNLLPSHVVRTLQTWQLGIHLLSSSALPRSPSVSPWERALSTTGVEDTQTFRRR
jgi:hypothetical protein